MQRKTGRIWKSPRAVDPAPLPIPIHPARALTTILSLEEEFKKRKKKKKKGREEERNKRENKSIERKNWKKKIKSKAPHGSAERCRDGRPQLRALVASALKDYTDFFSSSSSPSPPITKQPKPSIIPAAFQCLHPLPAPPPRRSAAARLPGHAPPAAWKGRRNERSAPQPWEEEGKKEPGRPRQEGYCCGSSHQTLPCPVGAVVPRRMGYGKSS